MTQVILLLLLQVLLFHQPHGMVVVVLIGVLQIIGLQALTIGLSQMKTTLVLAHPSQIHPIVITIIIRILL